MKKRISVITLVPRSGNFYAGQFQDIFWELAEVQAYSTEDGSVERIVPFDLYVVSTDAFEAAEKTRQYVPAAGREGILLCPRGGGSRAFCCSIPGREYPGAAECGGISEFYRESCH